MTICSAANWSRNEHGAWSQYRSLVWRRPFSSSESLALTSRVISMGFSTEPVVLKLAPVWQHYMQHWRVSIQCQGCVGPWWEPCTYFGNQKNWLYICGVVLLGLQRWLIGSSNTNHWSKNNASTYVKKIVNNKKNNDGLYSGLIRSQLYPILVQCMQSTNCVIQIFNF